MKKIKVKLRALEGIPLKEMAKTQSMPDIWFRLQSDGDKLQL
jgi:hypothetical protein